MGYKKELRYVVSLNGTFLKSFEIKLESLEYAREYIKTDIFSTIYVDAIELELFKEYLKLLKDDDFLIENSKNIMEI